MVLDGNISETHIYNEPDINKSKDFVDSLLSGAGLNSGSPIICERIIIRFLEKNASGLKKFFREKGLYPAMGTDRALELVYRSLYGRVIEKVLPVINRFIESADFSFLDKISISGTVSDDFRKEKLHDFVQMLFRDPPARFNMNGVYNIFLYQVLEKYMTEIFRRRDFLYQKLFTEQKTAVNRDEFIVLLKVLLLVKNAVFMDFAVDPNNPGMKIELRDVSHDRKKLLLYTDSLKKFIIPFLPGFPEPVIDLAVKSNLTDSMTDADEYICKFLFILNARFQNYENILKPDRGAESPDKSWFNLAEKNSLYFGYNIDIVKSLQAIAGANNW